jgi:ADP-ribosylglycohydrolase
MTDRPKTTLRNCIYGLAVGDALGVPYEFRPRGTFECTNMIGYGTHEQPAGTWSDDTSMTLATCDSIRELGRIDTEDMRDKFVSWIANDEYTIDGVFDYGGTTARALRSGKGGSGERDNGNGSLMRIAPLAFADATDKEIREVSAITHAHRTSTESCVKFIELLRSEMDGTLPEWTLCLKDAPSTKSDPAASCATRLRQPLGASSTLTATMIVCLPPSTWATTPTPPQPSQAPSPAQHTAWTQFRRNGSTPCAVKS